MSTPGNTTIVCAYCGAESTTWTAFCVRCGVPRATAAPAGFDQQAPAAVPAHAAQVAPVPVAVAPSYAQPFPVQPQLAQQFPSPALRPAVADVFVPPGLAPEFGELTTAGPGRRIAAFTIDAALVAVVSVVVGFVTASAVLAGLAAVELAVGLLVWEANRGKTVGNALLRLRTTRAEQPRTAGPVRAGVRGLVLGAGLLVAAVGAWVVVASTAWDRNGRNQGWHDRAGRTVTLALPAGRRTTTTTVREASSAAAPVQAKAAVRAGSAGGATTGSAPVTASAASTPVGFVSSAAPVAPAVPSASAVPSAPASPGETAAERSERAEAIEYISPTVMSTRLTIEEIDDDSFSDGGQLAPQPAASAEAPGGATPTSSTMLFAFDTGQQVQVPVPGTGVIGRNPRVFTEGDVLIAIDDPAKSMSKSHLLFSLTEGALQVLDYGSTNGSEILDDEGDSLPLVANEWTVVPTGSRVRVGQRVFTVSAVEVSR